MFAQDSTTANCQNEIDKRGGNVVECESGENGDCWPAAANILQTINKRLTNIELSIALILNKTLHATVVVAQHDAPFKTNAPNHAQTKADDGCDMFQTLQMLQLQLHSQQQKHQQQQQEFFVPNNCHQNAFVDEKREERVLSADGDHTPNLDRDDGAPHHLTHDDNVAAALVLCHSKKISTNTFTIDQMFADEVSEKKGGVANLDERSTFSTFSPKLLSNQNCIDEANGEEKMPQNSAQKPKSLGSKKTVGKILSFLNNKKSQRQPIPIETLKEKEEQIENTADDKNVGNDDDVTESDFSTDAILKAAQRAVRSPTASQPKIFAWQMLRDAISDKELSGVRISVRSSSGDTARALIARQQPKIRVVMRQTLKFYGWDELPEEQLMAKTKLLLGHLKNNAKVRNWSLRREGHCFVAEQQKQKFGPMESPPTMVASNNDFWFNQTLMEIADEKADADVDFYTQQQQQQNMLFTDDEEKFDEEVGGMTFSPLAFCREKLMSTSSSNSSEL